MKKILFILTVFCGIFGNGVFAQDTLNVASPQIAQAILKKIDHEVSLTEEQSEQVYALLLARSKQFNQARLSKHSIADREPLYAEANEQALSKLKEVLTPEQYDKFLFLRQQEEKHKERFPQEKANKTDQDVELDF